MLRSSLWPGSLRVIAVRPNSTLRLDLLPLLRPMRQSYQFKQHGVAVEDEEEDEDTKQDTTMLVTEETSETTLSFMIPSLYLRLRGEEMKTALEAKREHNHLSKKEAKDAAERESLDAITEMLDSWNKKYVTIMWKRRECIGDDFLCNDAFRSSKQKEITPSKRFRLICMFKIYLWTAIERKSHLYPRALNLTMKARRSWCLS